MALLFPTPQTRSLPLEPQDWFWSTWRSLEPIPLPAARPFQPEVLMGLLQAPAVWHLNHYYWKSLAIPRSLTEAEARLWLAAMTCPPALASWRLSFQTLTHTVQDAIDRAIWETPLTPEAARDSLGNHPYMAAPELILPLLNLFEPETVLSWILEPQALNIQAPYFTTYVESAQNMIATALVLGWQVYAVPYLTGEQRQRCREEVEKALGKTLWQPHSGQLAPPVYYLAASLGGFESVLQAVISTWSADRFQAFNHSVWLNTSDFVQRQQMRPQEIIFGLADPAAVQFEMERLNLRLPVAEYVKAWLAHTEYAGLERLKDTVLNLAGKEQITLLMRQLGNILAPEMAPVMLDLTQNSATAELASRWLTDHPQLSMAGILGSLQGQGTIPKKVHQYLRRRSGRGDSEWMRNWVETQFQEGCFTPAVYEQLQNLWNPSHTQCLDEHTTPEWLAVALSLSPTSSSGKSSSSKSRLPKWLDAGDLMPLACDDRQGQERSFSKQQMEAVLQACRQSSLTTPHPVLQVLKDHLNPTDVAEFAWELFDRWTESGTPSKDQWAMQTLGLLGNDAIVLKLTPLICAWPAEGKHKRAILGLDCLKAIGTETALMQIHTLSRRVSLKSVKTKALQCLETLAQERGLTPEQLEDRIVPDCGLNAQGSKIYDYGPRQFRVVLSADLKPLIRDDQNKLKASLPRPTKQDDRTLAEAAQEDWKVLKKTLSQVVSLQAKRLERAMIEQRRWQRSEFETYLLGHPVLLNLAQRLIWGQYDSSQPCRCFRITEDGTYGDPQDEQIWLEGESPIGIVHPAELDTAQRQQWGQLLSDYEIVPPFSQLSRTVFSLLPEEEGQTHIQRFRGAEPPALIASAIFKNTGWEALSYAYGKLYPQAKLLAIVSFTGWGETMPLEDLYFVPQFHSISDPSQRPAIPLQDISAVVLSEAIRNVGAVASKAQS